MINCGGGDEIVNLFTAPPETKVYVLDSHRPLSLENLLADNNHICVFDDESESPRVTEAIAAYEKMMVIRYQKSLQPYAYSIYIRLQKMMRMIQKTKTTIVWMKTEDLEIIDHDSEDD
jgi:hypothetical protein